MEKKIQAFLMLFVVFFMTNTGGGDLNAQTTSKKISVDDIWGKYTFRPEVAPGFNFQNDGKHYAIAEEGRIISVNLATGDGDSFIFEPSQVKNMVNFKFDEYIFSADEKQILFQTSSENIYRRSAKAKFLLWDGKNMTDLYDKEKQSNPAFSPTGEKVAFTSANNLFVRDLKTGKISQATKDGEKNKIINGFCDWVYEEEFEFTKAYEWSPDGSKIAFLRFDETLVPEFTMQNYRGGMYPEAQTFKYPKVGERNSIVTVWIYDVKKNKAKQVNVTGEYFPRLQWTPDGELCIYKMNRHQNEIELLLVNSKQGLSTLYTEKNKAYIELKDNNLTFTADKKHFIWLSEKDGFQHLYLFDRTGKEVRDLTGGNFDVTEFYGFDEKRQRIFYQAAERSPLTRQVFAADLNGKKEVICDDRGDNAARFSSTFDYYLLTHSELNMPTRMTVFETNGNKETRKVFENKKIAAQMDEFGANKVEFFSFKTSENVDLNGWMLKPKDFDPNKKYPVFMTQYSGPGSQRVLDKWMGQDFWWYQLLAQRGYIVACVDGRGTGGRGEAFKKITYLQLGHYEVMDQIEAAKHFASLPYVDGKRIGIFGWSYGGYMSTLCILKGNKTFKAAIAVAPVTNWKWYDNIYTERYMKTQKENKEGYEDNSPVNFAERLEGNYLLIHGLGDDNVHFQHSAEMVNALVKANKQFESAYYPNRNHGISGGVTRLNLFTKMLNFITEKL
ncbi:MAG: hypothetical protein RL757_1604 [Bacteroidota bacterium]|jgi:dipeptidyl-peptidase-4